MEEEVGGRDMEVLLISKKIEIQQKPFCFEFKENSHHQYLQISRNSFSILVPSSGISCFLDAIDCLCLVPGKQKEEEEEVVVGFSKLKEVKINDKVFCFRVGHSMWGRFLKVWEASASKNNSCIIIPSGDNGNNGWKLFRKTLAEVYKTSRVLFPPCQRSCVPVERQVEFADAKCDSITSPVLQNSSVSQLNVESSQNENGKQNKNCSSTEKSKMMSVGSKSFYFNLGSNERGRFLKINQMKDGFSSIIVIPLSAMQQFHEKVGHFVKLADESLTSTSLKQCSSHDIKHPSEFADVKSDSITSPNAQKSSVSKLNVEASQNEKGHIEKSKMMRAGSKDFYFNHGSNNLGHFLRISEVTIRSRSPFFITIPLSAMQQFHETVGYFCKLSNESLL